MTDLEMEDLNTLSKEFMEAEIEARETYNVPVDLGSHYVTFQYMIQDRITWNHWKGIC